MNTTEKTATALPSDVARVQQEGERLFRLAKAGDLSAQDRAVLEDAKATHPEVYAVYLFNDIKARIGSLSAFTDVEATDRVLRDFADSIKKVHQSVDDNAGIMQTLYAYRAQIAQMLQTMLPLEPIKLSIRPAVAKEAAPARVMVKPIASSEQSAANAKVRFVVSQETAKPPVLETEARKFGFFVPAADHRATKPVAEAPSDDVIRVSRGRAG